MANRQNSELTNALATLAAVATAQNVTTGDFVNAGAQGIVLLFNCTSLGGGAPTLAAQLMIKDRYTGNTVAYGGTGSAVTLAVGLNVLLIMHLGVTPGTVYVNAPLPARFQVKLTTAGTGTTTGTLVGQYVI